MISTLIAVAIGFLIGLTVGWILRGLWQIRSTVQHIDEQIDNWKRDQ